MVKWQLNVCRPRTRSARFYQVFGREPDYPWPFLLLQFILSCFKCALFNGLLFVLTKWYLWPTVGPALTRYSVVQTTLNRSSSLLDRLRATRH